MYLRGGTITIWRSPTQAQFALDPRWAVTLDNLDLTERALIKDLEAGLDVSLTGSRLAHPLQQAGVLVPDRPTATSADALVWSQICAHGRGHQHLQERQSVRVHLPSVGPTATVIAHNLHAAGIGYLDQKTLPSTDIDLLILITGHTVDPVTSANLVAERTPHIPIIFTDTAVQVGPTVVPGTGPCLGCLDRHRAAADPHWGRVAAQLVRKPWGEETSLAAWAGATATSLALALADGRGKPGYSLTLTADDPIPSVAIWDVHPSCECDQRL